MLAHIVQYLRSNNVSFRLSSHPAPEPLPTVAYHLPPGGVMVETCVVLIAGKPAIACVARRAQLSLPRLKNELGAAVFEGSAQDLPAPFTGIDGPIPPLGGALGGIATLLDESLGVAAAIAFPVFSGFDVIELPYDDFLHVERPRIASFSFGGELPEGELDDPEALAAVP